MCATYIEHSQRPSLSGTGCVERGNVQVECLAAAAAARLGEALLREDGLTGGDAVCRSRNRRAACRGAVMIDARMIVQVAADSGKVDLSMYPSLIRFLGRADAGAQQDWRGSRRHRRTERSDPPQPSILLSFADEIDRRLPESRAG